MRVFPAPVTSLLETATGTKPLIFIKIWFGFDFEGQLVERWYCDKTVGSVSSLPPGGGIGGGGGSGKVFPGKILQFSGLESIAQVTAGGSVGSVSLTLDDTDNDIKDILDTRDIHHRLVFVYQGHDKDNLDTESDLALLFTGRISSPIIWKENSRTISFDVVANIEASEVGFSSEQGYFTNLDNRDYGKIWPICFGSPLKVPAVKIRAKAQTGSETQYVVFSLERLKEFKKLISEYVKAYTKLDNLKTTQDLSAERITKRYTEAHIDVVNTYNRYYQFYLQLVRDSPEFEYYEAGGTGYGLRVYKNALISYEFLRSHYNVLINEKEDTEAKIKNLTVQIQKSAGDPTKKARLEQEKSDAETYLEQVDEAIDDDIDDLTTYQTQYRIQEDLLLRFVISEIKIEDGSIFPSGTRTFLVNGAKLQGQVSNNKIILDDDDPILATYTNVDFGNRDNLPADIRSNPLVFYVDDPDIDLKNQYCLIDGEPDTTRRVIRIIDQVGQICYADKILYCQVGEGEPSYLEILWDNDYSDRDYDAEKDLPTKIRATSPFILAAWWDSITKTDPYIETGIDFDIDHEQHEVIYNRYDWRLDIGTNIELFNNPKDVYVCNSVYSTAIKQVLAYRVVNNRRTLCPIPSSYYTKHLAYSLGNMTVTLLSFKKPLIERDEGWEDQIFVSLTSSLSANTASAIQWLINNYTNITPDAGSFATVAAQIANYPSHFAIVNRANVLDIVYDIAWQARCGLLIRNNRAYIKYLAKASASVKTLNVSNIKEIELTFTNTEDVTTKLIAGWSPDSIGPPREIVLRNNIAKYGTLESRELFWIYNIPALVIKSATFWLLRYSNTWKKIKVFGFLDLLKIEAFDVVTLDFADNLLASSAVRGMVESVNYNSDTLECEFTIWVAVRAGFLAEYPFAWSGDAGVGVGYPTLNDPYAGGATDPVADVVNSGGSEFGFSYTTRAKDVGSIYPGDANDSSPYNRINDYEETDYPIFKAPDAIRLPSLPFLDLQNTRIIDPVTGLESRLSDVFTVQYGQQSQDYQGSDETNAEKLCLKSTTNIHGEYWKEKEDPNDPNDEGETKTVLAPIDLDYNEKPQFWSLKKEWWPFLAKIIGHESIGTYKWKYEWEEVILDNLTPHIPVEGRKGTFDTDPAYNIIELNNDGSGVQGNSVDDDNLPGTFELQPVGGDPSGGPHEVIVIMYTVFMKDGSRRFVFQYENAVDGICE